MTIAARAAEAPRRRHNARSWWRLVVLLIGALVFLFPFYYMIVGSLQKTENTSLGGAIPQPGNITLHNYGQIRQLDLTVGVAYGTNIDQVLALVREILQAHPRVLKDPAPVLGISALAESAINLSIKPWTTVPDFGAAQAELYQTLLEQFRASRIEIPFPQREVRMLNRA